ncbi:hypothetical protein [Burkholderia multivorans]|uniref:hypothetical protein n=1 Tax=Burkholderia multivorans TaxID=87883 RepID=UPI002018C533|nr:hypothetical protein [Burkholderia multivorans]MCO1421089.1 hypothetical protein [Burkholderia multivorans]MDR9053460.1 hypothetical protein [Burkholderia multivorans]MDR9060232.1 hypothetical protein [Burkholderia multivorans]MDR9066486.1 hypothetical protein [Burkholderia multivorans]MDR9072013.1 hypothetical protein [Burkholderia multivorans]
MPNVSRKNTTHHKNRSPNYITMLIDIARIFTDCDRPFGLFAVLALIAISNGGL